MLAHADKYSQAFSAEPTTKTVNGRNLSTMKVIMIMLQGNYNKNDEWLYSSFWYKDFDGNGIRKLC